MQTRPTYSWEKYKNKWMEKTQSFSINDAMAPTHVETQRMNFNLHLTFHIKSTPVAPGCFQPEPQWCSSILLTWSLQHLRPATCPGMLPWSPEHSVLLSHPCNIKYQLAFRPLWEVLWSPIANPEWTHHNHLCMCTVCMPGAYRGWRGHCISWNWRYKQLWTAWCGCWKPNPYLTLLWHFKSWFICLPARSYLVSKCSLGFLGKFLTWVNENTYLGAKRQFNHKMTAVQAWGPEAHHSLHTQKMSGTELSMVAYVFNQSTQKVQIEDFCECKVSLV